MPGERAIRRPSPILNHGRLIVIDGLLFVLFASLHFGWLLRRGQWEIQLVAQRPRVVAAHPHFFVRSFAIKVNQHARAIRRDAPHDALFTGVEGDAGADWGKRQLDDLVIVVLHAERVLGYSSAGAL